MKWLMSVALASLVTRAMHAEIVFTQDFSAHPNGPVSDYVSSTPNDGQWNGIGASGSASSTVVNGVLRYTHGSATGSGYFARTTDFSPTPQVLIYQFDLAVSGTTASKSVGRLQLGSGFTTANAVASTGVRAEVSINFSGANTFSFRSLADDSTILTGSQNILWVVNNSNSAFTYLAPNNSMETVNPGHWDLWASWMRLFDERPLLAGTDPLTDMKFVLSSGSGTIDFDDFQLEAIPESGATGALAGLVVLVGIVVGRRVARPET